MRGSSETTQVSTEDRSSDQCRDYEQVAASDLCRVWDSWGRAAWNEGSPQGIRVTPKELDQARPQEYS